MRNDLSAECRALTEETLAANDWTLAHEWVKDELRVRDDFVDCVVAGVAPKPLAGLPATTRRQIVKAAVIRCYSRLLYQAGSSFGTLWQEMAFRELWGYAYRLAFYKLDGDETSAEESAQRVLLTVWQKFARAGWPPGFMRDPAAFLGFVAQIVVNDVKQEIARRMKQREKEILVADLPRDQDDEQDVLDRAAQSRPSDEVTSEPPDLVSTNRQAVIEAIRACLRSRQQARVVVARFLEGKTVVQVARELKTDPANVHVLTSRGLKNLRRCAGLYERLIDILGGGSTGGPKS